MTNKQAVVFGLMVLTALLWVGAILTYSNVLFALAGYGTANMVRSVMSEIK